MMYLFVIVIMRIVLIVNQTPGMIFEAQKKYDIDLKKSYFIGDRWRDIGAGNRAKCKTIFIDRKYNEKNIFKAKYNVRKIKEIINIIK